MSLGASDISLTGSIKSSAGKHNSRKSSNMIVLIGFDPSTNCSLQRIVCSRERTYGEGCGFRAVKRTQKVCLVQRLTLSTRNLWKSEVPSSS